MSAIGDMKTAVASLASGLAAVNDDLQAVTEPTTGTDCDIKTAIHAVLASLKEALDEHAQVVLSTQTTLNGAVSQAEMDKNLACTPPP